MYTIQGNEFYKNNEKLKGFGCALYAAHTTSPGYIERCIQNGMYYGQHTLFRMVLIFENYRGEDILKAPVWSLLKDALDIAQRYGVGLTIELGSSLVTYLERKNENPYAEKWDTLFDDVFKKGCLLFSSHPALFCFSVINEFGPYQKPQTYFDAVFRRLRLSGQLIKKYSENKILVASGGILHLSDKSGGEPGHVFCEWIHDGKKRVPYWQGVYSCPSIDFNMIHIYSTINKINDGESEWSNFTKYHDFSRLHNKPIIVDEFGLKLPKYSTDLVTKKGLRFLNSIEGVLKNMPMAKRPPIIQIWNFKPTSQGFDWWPEYSYHHPLFQKIKEMSQDIFRNCSSNNIDFESVSTKPHLGRVVKILDFEDHKVYYDFKKNMLGHKLMTQCNFKQTIPLAKWPDLGGISFIIFSNIVKSSFNLHVRFHLFLKHVDGGDDEKYRWYLQEFQSMKQNAIIPSKIDDKKNGGIEQYPFANFSYEDFKIFGRDGQYKKNFILKAVKLQLVCLHPLEDVTGGIFFKHLTLHNRVITKKK